MEQFLNEYAALLFNNVPGVISVSLVSTLDGSIVAYKARPGVDNRLASSYENTEGLANKTVDDVCLVYQGQTHLIGLLQSKKVLDHVILDDTAIVGLAKLLIRKIRTETESKSFL